MPGHPAVRIGAAHKRKFESWLAEEIGHVFGDAEQSATLARHIVLLMDGAFSAMLTHRDPSYVDAAGTAARHLVEAAQANR